MCYGVGFHALGCLSGVRDSAISQLAVNSLTVSDVLIRDAAVGFEVAVLSLETRTTALLSLLNVLEDCHWSDSDYQAPLHAWVECNVAVATSNVAFILPDS